jgi:hypothetical protein
VAPANPPARAAPSRPPSKYSPGSRSHGCPGLDRVCRYPWSANAPSPHPRDVPAAPAAPRSPSELPRANGPAIAPPTPAIGRQVPAPLVFRAPALSLPRAGQMV